MTAFLHTVRSLTLHALGVDGQGGGAGSEHHVGREAGDEDEDEVGAGHGCRLFVRWLKLQLTVLWQTNEGLRRRPARQNLICAFDEPGGLCAELLPCPTSERERTCKRSCFAGTFSVARLSGELGPESRAIKRLETTFF